MSRPATRGRLPPDEVHRRRVAAARERILVVLQHRVTCYRRELERLVCEVGFNFETTPRWKRPEPHHFSEAIRALVDEGLVDEHNIPIKGTSYRFWSHGKATANSSQAVLNRKVAALTVFLAVEHRPQEAGWHAEKIHHLAMTAGPWLSVGQQRRSPPTHRRVPAGDPGQGPPGAPKELGGPCARPARRGAAGGLPGRPAGARGRGGAGVDR